MNIKPPKDLYDGQIQLIRSINEKLNVVSNRLSALEEKMDEKLGEKFSLMDSTSPETTSTEVIRRKKINECLEELEFEKIHKVMEMLNWQWSIHTNFEDRCEVPTVSYMKMHVKNMLHECYEEMDKNDEDWRISTGGFVVRTFKDNDCEVTFELTSWYTGE